MIKKRVFVSILWLYSCWVAGGVAEYFLGTPALVGLAVGIAAAAFFGLDPFGVVWPRTEDESVGVEVLPSVETGPAVRSALAR